jgi:transcriptional regulator with XRE-family HTH domain
MSSKLKENLKDKEYRDAFVAAYVRNGVAFQIRAMRDSRGWDQKKLAEKMGNAKLQPIISRYENPDYGRYSMTTLLDLAQAFDVGLIVKFAPFSEIIERDEEILEESLDVDSYAKDLLRSAPVQLIADAGSEHQATGESNFLPVLTGVQVVNVFYGAGVPVNPQPYQMQSDESFGILGVKIPTCVQTVPESRWIIGEKSGHQ